jgi:hypothetical protein
VSLPGAPLASRVLVVGQDADVSMALHLHLDRAGFACYCLPGPGELEAIVRAVAPHVIVLILPAAPDGTWGNALTTAANAARVGVRVVMVAPSREVVEPLAAVAGAERALSRSEVMSKPLVVVERLVGAGLVGGAAAPPPAPAAPPAQPPRVRPSRRRHPRRAPRPARARPRSPIRSARSSRPARGSPRWTSWRSSTRSWRTSRASGPCPPASR